MSLKTVIASFTFFLFVLLNSCSGQTKNILNENELSIVMLQDTVSYYNGILDKNTKVMTIPYDTTVIRSLIKKNKEKYKDRLRVFIKLSDKISVVEPVVKIAEIGNEEMVFVTAFPLTETEKTRFAVKEFSWEPQEPAQVIMPTSVTVRENQIPSFTVEMRKDNSVWYKIMWSPADTGMKKINDPVKENLKKILAAYKDTISKENIQPVFYIQGDQSIKYPEFKEVLTAFKENDIFKFQMIAGEDIYQTSPVDTRSINLFLPKDDGNEQKIIRTESTLTLLILKNNILAYKSDNIAHTETFDYKTIRKKLMNESKNFGDKFFVIIKPGEEASYTNTVAILDEMAICNIKRYAMVSLLPVEIEIIKKFNSVNGR